MGGNAALVAALEVCAPLPFGYGLRVRCLRSLRIDSCLLVQGPCFPAIGAGSGLQGQCFPVIGRLFEALYSPSAASLSPRFTLVLPSKAVWTSRSLAMRLQCSCDFAVVQPVYLGARHNIHQSGPRGSGL